MLVAYRLLAPGSEWRLHREWFRRSALADLLGEDAGLAEIHKLYLCHDRLRAHQQTVFIKLPHATAAFSNRRARLGLGDGSRDRLVANTGWNGRTRS